MDRLNLTRNHETILAGLSAEVAVLRVDPVRRRQITIASIRWKDARAQPHPIVPDSTGSFEHLRDLCGSASRRGCRASHTRVTAARRSFRLAEASGSRTHHRRRKTTITGFEDQDDHRTACASRFRRQKKTPQISTDPHGLRLGDRQSEPVFIRAHLRRKSYFG